MTTYRVFTVSSMWSTAKLTKEVEKELMRLTQEGYEIVSISFGFNVWMVATAFITTRKEV